MNKDYYYYYYCIHIPTFYTTTWYIFNSAAKYGNFEYRLKTFKKVSQLTIKYVTLFNVMIAC